MDAVSGLRLENANYEKVLYYIDKMLSESDAYCRCGRCRMDVAALALNTLPPHYFVAPSHVKQPEVGSPWILIEMAVREAMVSIRSFPNHKHDEALAAEDPLPGLTLMGDAAGAEG
jgi:hypothetical protein